ncbi:acetyltransferase [Pseudoalteromonas luteoviolacea]|uniref:Acetyltransferase n=1 Tax=Pseudoalteromonas luteoviolacea TaxID=43657 RepID=A0A1C0TRK1_9GAMM|nr:GNAT family N-acetyltransferase [Pseudoalteromonas luteoviolacea]OCQ21889.1 acetyltransferase [Pseudoalteromonas luteoviolacea]
MEIRYAKQKDVEQITALITHVSELDVLPLFDSQGRREYMSRVIPDIETTFNTNLFDTFVATQNEQVVGFAALRDKHYITHLFVAKKLQGSGFGKALLDKLLAQTRAKHVSLRSSVNAQHFYEKYGFTASEPECAFMGIRYVPMTLDNRLRANG